VYAGNNSSPEYNYVEAYLDLVAARVGMSSYSQMRLLGGPTSWVSFLSSHASKKRRKQNLGSLFSFWWMVWKERNRRTFDFEERPPLQLDILTLSEI
jgi:hypothetical protein